MVSSITVSERHVLGYGDPAIAKYGLEEVLVHAERGGSDAGSDVGDASKLEETLHRAVLAERPVEDGEHDVDLGDRSRRSLVGDHGHRFTRALAPRGGKALSFLRDFPAPVAADLDRGRLVALRVQCCHDGPGRSNRDLVLARASAREDRDAKAPRHELGLRRRLGRRGRRRLAREAADE